MRSQYRTRERYAFGGDITREGRQFVEMFWSKLGRIAHLLVVYVKLYESIGTATSSSMSILAVRVVGPAV